ncbi:Outer membrane TonB-dependent transporter, utilization system for glycans and polysaccharides (PUL), SusC family [hydrothermal vent metagenome]|uniref:Outer membrane TonB-dependent transporter, utilization system for glycans and polysaccharides (PUL), SusC family n=1 Tax=hydrothermal vent metagenome TaxID=652676 RepID=A0A3B0WYL4_9ZZZZ
MNIKQSLKISILIFMPTAFCMHVPFLFAADMASPGFTLVRATAVSGGSASTGSVNFNLASSIASPTADTDANSPTFGLVRVFPVLPDEDGDTITSNLDNCLRVANGSQLDTDNDNFGNRCDGDLNNDGQINTLDLGLFKQRFNTNDTDADFNGDGNVDSLDLGIFKSLFGRPPGPSALAP